MKGSVLVHCQLNGDIGVRSHRTAWLLHRSATSQRGRATPQTRSLVVQESLLVSAHGGLPESWQDSCSERLAHRTDLISSGNRRIKTSPGKSDLLEQKNGIRGSLLEIILHHSLFSKSCLNGSGSSFQVLTSAPSDLL